MMRKTIAAAATLLLTFSVVAPVAAQTKSTVDQYQAGGGSAGQDKVQQYQAGGGSAGQDKVQQYQAGGGSANKNSTGQYSK